MELGKLVTLPKIFDPRGNLTMVEGTRHVPFTISRVYWIYGVPQGENRGGHAHKHCRQLVVAVSGSFRVTLDNGKEKKHYRLDQPHDGLLLERGIWRMLDDFSPNAVCLVIAEDPYDEQDYIRDYNEFLAYRGR